MPDRFLPTDRRNRSSLWRIGPLLLAVLGILCIPLSTGDLFGAHAQLVHASPSQPAEDLPPRFSVDRETGTTATAVSAVDVIIDLADGPGDGFNGPLPERPEHRAPDDVAGPLPAARIAADGHFAYGPRAPPSA